MNFEDYLRRLLETHAWRVEPAGMSSPSGVTLIIHKEPYRYAVVVIEQPGRSIGADAVVRARQGADEFFCTHAAIIAQGEFTESARREALSPDSPVALIGRNDFFQMAKILEQPLFELLPEARRPFPWIPVLTILGILMMVVGFVWFMFFSEPVTPLQVVSAPVTTPEPTPAAVEVPVAPPAERTPRPPIGDNKLTPEEVAKGWISLFDGFTGRGWTDSSRKSARVKVEAAALSPFGAGERAIFTKSAFGNFELHLDYKVSPGYVGGIVVRQFPLDGGDGFRSNGLEISISDVYDGSYEAAGAFRDLVYPKINAAKPAGEWNQLDVFAQKDYVSITLNGQEVATINLAEWTKPNLRPDGSRHRLSFPVGRRAKVGYLALPTGDRPAYFKNIRIRKLDNLGM